MQRIGHLELVAGGAPIRVMWDTIEGGTPCILLRTAQREPFALLTIAAPGIRLREGEALIKTWGENAALRAPCLDSGLFQDTGRRVPLGAYQAEVWKVAVPPKQEEELDD